MKFREGEKMSLTIDKTIGDEILVALTGRLDTASSPELEAELNELLPMKKPITIDMAGLDYISSAGLRVILMAQKQVNSNASSMKIVNVNEIIMEIFEMTGFVDILTIE